LDPLKYPDANRLVSISRVNAKSNLDTPPTVEQLHAWQNARSLQGLEGVSTSKQTLEAGGDPVSAHVAMVSPTFPRFAGARVLLGRFILADDAKAGEVPVVVISEHVWRSRFGAATDVIGKTLKLEGTQHSIVGVLIDGVRVPSYIKEPVDAWVPFEDKGFLGGPAIGKLANGSTIASVQEELGAIARNIEAGDASGPTFDISVRAPGSTQQIRTSVLMIAGAVCLLLLIACANVAHLLLARGAARERELAIRAALGAGRGRIIRQLVTESLILSMGGCIAGLAVGALSLRAIVALRPPNLEELGTARIDGRVLLVTILLSVLTGIVFGLVAGFSGRGGRSFEVLRSSVASTTDRARNRLRSLLVVTENALSVVLLIGAVLLIRTVVNLYNITPGFDATNVYAMTVELPKTRYSNAAAREVYADRLLAEAKLVPGVDEATIATNAPSRVGVMIGNWVAEGREPVQTANAPAFTAMNTVRPGYFDIIRLRLANGAGFSANAVQNHEVIVSQSMARKLWGDDNVVGKRLRMGGRHAADPKDIVWNVVAGVAPDVALLSLTDKGVTPGIYYPMSKAPESHLTLIVRLRSDRVPVTAFRRAFLSIDPSMSPPEVVSITELLLRSISTHRFLMALLTIFAILAVALSA
ncbi:MAG: ABC transporter permease, partial [Gemmatimonadaceae bacterium]